MTEINTNHKFALRRMDNRAILATANSRTALADTKKSWEAKGIYTYITRYKGHKNGESI